MNAPLESHRRLLWGLSYRMTGDAADADDIVQETFRRAIERPPPDTDQPWAPWLVRVATNLGRDLLRRRKRTRYVGPWLPSPLESSEAEPPSVEAPRTEGRYDLLESVTFAFLLALEVLSPRQRAVLLLRDVFDYSVQETAAALSMSASNVKTTLHRARNAMQPYDQRRCPPTPERQAETQEALVRFMGLLAAQDLPGIESMLAGSVVTMSDGGGEFWAARRPVRGPWRVARFWLGLTRRTQRHGGEIKAELRQLNGWPAILLRIAHGPPRAGDRISLHLELDATGQVIALHAVLASRKLGALSFPALDPG